MGAPDVQQGPPAAEAAQEGLLGAAQELAGRALGLISDDALLILWMLVAGTGVSLLATHWAKPLVKGQAYEHQRLYLRLIAFVVAFGCTLALELNIGQPATVAWVCAVAAGFSSPAAYDSWYAWRWRRRRPIY